MGRDTSHYRRILQAPSNQALGTSRDPGAARAALSTLCQGLTSLTVNNSFLTSDTPTVLCTAKPKHKRRCLVLFDVTEAKESSLFAPKVGKPGVLGKHTTGTLFQ